MASYWDVIVPLVTAWVTNKYGNPQGDTPNQYPAILPPEMKRIADEAWRVYQQGGSPTQQDVRALALQSVAQTPSAPPNFQFMSQELKGQPFAGGITAPKFDISKLPSVTGAATALTAPKFTGGGRAAELPIAGSRPGLKDKEPVMQPIDIDPDTPYKNAWNNGGPSGFGNEFTNDLPEGMSYADGSQAWQNVQSWWSDYQAKHPNWARVGPGAAAAALGLAFGLPGAAAGAFLKRLLGGGAQQPPPAVPSIPPTIPYGGTPSDIPRGGM